MLLDDSHYVSEIPLAMNSKRELIRPQSRFSVPHSSEGTRGLSVSPSTNSLEIHGATDHRRIRNNKTRIESYVPH